MFLFQYHEDRLRLLADEQRRDEPRRRLLRELAEQRSDASAGRGRQAPVPVAAPRGAPYTGAERRLVPCPEMKDAMTL